MSRTHRARRALVAVPILALGALLAPPARSEDAEEASAGARFETAVATAKALDASFARVEFALRYDEGDAPERIGSGSYASNYGGYVTEERPLEMVAIVLAPDRVVTADPRLHPRFVTSVTVIFRGQRVAATPFAYPVAADGLVLALERPLTGAVPLAFDEAAKPPYRLVFHGKYEGSWRTIVGGAFSRWSVDEDGLVTTDTWTPAVVVDEKDRPVGVTLADPLPIESRWKGSPLAGALIPAAERDRRVEKAGALAKAGVPRVHLRLRSPKESGGSMPRFMRQFGGSDDSEASDATERDVPGVVVGENRVLVLHTMDAEATSRLEVVTVHPEGGEPVPAKFVGTYRHYGAFLVETEKPIAGAVALSKAPVRSRRNQLLYVAEVRVQGEKRLVRSQHARFTSFSEGWRRQIVPEMESAANHYFFDEEGALVTIPVLRRLPERAQRWRADEPIAFPAEYLAPLLQDPAAHADPAIVPVVADREGRLAWLGVELQPLDRELARVNGVSAFTQDGRSGALVSYVYPGSPAAKAGLEAGLVLLRLHTPDRPKPVDVEGSDDRMSFRASFFEGMGEDVEERFGDMMGFQPWPSIETELNKTLTAIGFGKPITLEYANGGAVKKVELVVEESPVHYEAAPLHKSEPLGFTVKDLTYEVRRHYQLDGTPAADGTRTPPVEGVIVSKVERGGRAAVAGLRRFDVVLRVNDAPVTDVAGFAKAIAVPGEIRLGVKDKLKERVVKIAAAQ